jgi:NitT/TauT family transport system permease protein
MSTAQAGRPVVVDPDGKLAAAIATERRRQPTIVTIVTQTYLFPILAIVALIVIWQLIVVLFDVSPLILPTPADVADEIFSHKSLLADHSWATFKEIVAGFVVSIVIGVPIAVAIAYSRAFERIVYPLLVTSQTLPKVALAPLFIVWFGFGFTPKLIISFLMSFFPIVISGVVGLKAIEPELVYVARSMGASAWQVFWKLRLPGSLPNLFGGLRIAITLSVVGAIVAEFVGADEGLGYLIQASNATLDTTLMFASLTILAAMGIVLYLVVERIEAFFLRHRRA